MSGAPDLERHSAPSGDVDRSSRPRYWAIRLSVVRTLALLFYYVVASRLPSTSFPGGSYFRRVRQFACRRFVHSTGDWINVESGAFIADGRYLSIGTGSSIGVGSRVYGATIGTGVMMGAGVTILKDNHPVTPDGRVVAGRSEAAPPVIGDGAWIGDRAIILPGRRIGANAIVGAGAVVTKDVDDWAVVAGNPARVIRSSLRGLSASAS